MKYREAKTLHNGDQVIRKSDQTPLIVKEIQVFGQYKKVLIHCVSEENSSYALYNDEVE